jgi:O-antigen ligase
MVLLFYYFILKIASLSVVKKYLTYSTFGLVFVLSFLYLIKFSSYASRIEDVLYDPQVLTLTGRLPLWLFAIDMWLERPWFGQGLEAWSSNALLDYVSLLGWAAPHAHNQILQILSQAGLVGFCIFLIWARQYVRIVRVAPANLRSRFWWLSAFFFLPGFTEVVLQYNIGPGNTLLTWIMFTMVVILGRSPSGHWNNRSRIDVSTKNTKQ